MIPAEAGKWKAHYGYYNRSKDSHADVYVAVMGWDSEGYALVLDAWLGKLVRARDTRPHEHGEPEFHFHGVYDLEFLEGSEPDVEENLSEFVLPKVSDPTESNQEQKQ